MSKKDDKKVSLTKPVLTQPVSTPAPEYKESKPAVKLEKPKTTTKTPKVVEVISDSNSKDAVVSFNSKSAPTTPLVAGSISERVQRFNSLVLKSGRIPRANIEELARTYLGDCAIFKGASAREIAFEIEGVRVPAEGYYFTL